MKLTADIMTSLPVISKQSQLTAKAVGQFLAHHVHNTQ